jgi:hypothetical protein
MAAGLEPVFCAEAVVHHDVRSRRPADAVREAWRWADLPLVLKGRPWARPGRAYRWIFWKRSHPYCLAALVGVSLAVRRPAALVLVLPWLRYRLAIEPEGGPLKERIRLLPAAFGLDATEAATMVRGSFLHRSILL